jgi:hypothetical protein
MTFEQIKNIENTHDTWAKLEETFEGTKGTKTAKAYILQDKFSSSKMQEDKSVPEMFNRLQVIVNDLKALGHERPSETLSSISVAPPLPPLRWRHGVESR